MSIAAVAHKHAFGLKADVRGNVHWIDDTTVVYPCGANAVIYNSETKTQKFIPVQDAGQIITAMALSPSKRFIAIAEKGETASVVIYDLLTLRRRKVLVAPNLHSNAGAASHPAPNAHAGSTTGLHEGGTFQLPGGQHGGNHSTASNHASGNENTKEIVSLSFSSDSKYLASLSGGPNHTLHNWSWEKAKIISSLKLGGGGNVTIHQVIFNPWDPTQLSVLGNGVFKCYRFVEGSMKQFGSSKVEPRVCLMMSVHSLNCDGLI
jgi:WD40 repeat protein